MKLKVCGMKYNTEEIASLGPDYLGFIFWKGSSRYVDDTPVLSRAGGPLRVGVFVDATPQEILQSCLNASLDLIQLHGSEEPAFCQELSGFLSDTIKPPPQLIKAFAVGEAFDFSVLEPYLDVCDYFLFDSRGPLPGGNGQAFDWTLLANYPYDKPFFLSGGIGPESLDALHTFVDSPAAQYCHAFDVNSRFEVRPGEKDPELLKTFMSAAFLTAPKNKRT